MVLLAAFMACLSSFLGIAREAGDSISPVEILYWYVLPALPFLILGFIYHAKKIKRWFPLSASAVAAGLAITAPFFLIYWDAKNYSGGGANIGLGLLYLAMPIYIPVVMVLGYRLAMFAKSK
jgi:peptidoglycan/LPS O-acetylase OafA/YrhL